MKGSGVINVGRKTFIKSDQASPAILTYPNLESFSQCLQCQGILERAVRETGAGRTGKRMLPVLTPNTL